MEILPAVGGTDESRAGAAEVPPRQQGQGLAPSDGQQSLASDPGRVVTPGPAQVRREERIQAEPRAMEPIVNEHDVAQRVGEEFQLEPVALVFVDDGGRGTSGLGVLSVVPVSRA